MTSMQDVVVSARRKLLADAGFVSLIGADVGKDAPGGAYTDGWLFKAVDDAYSPDRNPRNSGTSAVVLGMRGPSWTAPNVNHTLRFPTLDFRIYSDSTRSADLTLLIQRDADYRCDRVATAIKNVFNDVANNDHNWPNGVFIVSCVLWTDIKIHDIDNEDGLVAGDMTFALELA